MVTAQLARIGTSLRATGASGSAKLFMVVALLSGCAASGAPASAWKSADAHRAACDDFARGEVRRLGESVPAALARGFLIGLALALDQLSPAVYFRYGADWIEQPWQIGPMVRLGTAPLGASLIGAPRLARDAAQTNEEVYAQAIDRCMAPARLVREFGPGDARVATSLEDLADCYMWQRKYADAEPLRREAAAIWTALFGTTDSKVARALDDHAAALRHLHRDLEADALTARATGIRAELAARKAAQRPADVSRPSKEHPCDSPLNAALFTVCRHAPSTPDIDIPVLAASP
jgi:Tetratricopeptide repeat